MPHYWFRVPLDSTAPHLKRAKERGGPPAVTRALKADAHSRGKSIAAAEYPPDAQFCDTAVYSDEPMSLDECSWFHSRWETGDEGCPEPWYSTDEVVIDASSGWRLGGDATEAT